MMPFELKRQNFPYQPFYCEENIWHLCQQEPLTNSIVIFISAKGTSFPMFNQRATAGSSQAVYWDYHVILLLPAEKNTIFDFDTRLPFGTDIDTYMAGSFLDHSQFFVEEMPWFRIVSGEDYIKLFSSDRSHMKTVDGWLAPPPLWPEIGGLKHNLSEFIDMDNHEYGEVLTYPEFLNQFL